jgi:lysine-specific demethylase 3
MFHHATKKVINFVPDSCMTSLFSQTWMCQVCGRELCSECFADLSRSSFNATKSAGLTGLECTSLTSGAKHSQRDFVPTTRFHPTELESVIREMERVLDVGVPVSNPAEPVPETVAVKYAPQAPPILRQSRSIGTTKDASRPYHRTRLLVDNELSEATFLTIWELGDPILVEGFKSLSWSAEFFIRHYGEQECTTVHCVTGKQKTQQVRDFFSTFGTYGRNRDGPWKLKVR